MVLLRKSETSRDTERLLMSLPESTVVEIVEELREVSIIIL